MTRNIVPVDRSNCEHYMWGAGCDGWRLLTSAALSVIQERVPPGASEVMHFHSQAQQFFFVLSGHATLEFEDRSVELEAGQGLHVPPRAPHRFVNKSGRDVVFLVISSPTSAGDRTELTGAGSGMHTRLSVNLNKVALLRNQRDVGYPSVEEMARIAIAAGAHGITVHPRPDARHVRRADVFGLGELVRTYGGAVELNVEGFPSPEFVEMVCEVQPAQVTLVPDTPGQRTSDHGWRFADSADLLRPVVADLSRFGIRVSLFVEPDVAAMPVVKELGADCVELYTAAYAAAFAAGDCERTLAEYVAAAEAAHRCGLSVNAGHDLTLENLPLLKRGVPMLAEVSVGHAITADALKMGLFEAVRAYLATIA